MDRCIVFIVNMMLIILTIFTNNYMILITVIFNWERMAWKYQVVGYFKM